MAVRFACCGAALIAALTLGIAGAAARASATTTTVRMEVLGVGEIVDDKNQLDCGVGTINHLVCRVSYTGTGTVTFSEGDETPSGWTFSDISGCPDPCTLTLDQSDDDHELVATFDSTQTPGSATLTVAANGNSDGDGGTIEGDDIDCETGSTTDCTEDVPVGSTMTIAATPADGFLFTGWGGACSGTNRGCTLVMSQDRSATASFKQPRLTVTLNGSGTVTGGDIACTNGTGTCSSDEDAGDEITLVATPPTGGSFTSWGGACTGTSPTCTVTMSADRNVTANFSGGSTTPTTFSLSVSVTGNGTVTGGGLNCGAGGSTCTASATAGSIVLLTATPASGQTFQSWGGSCSGSSTTCSLTMSAARSVSATFSGGSSATVDLSVTVTGHGTVTGGGVTCGNGKATCTAKIKQDSTVGLTATPAARAKFVRWGGACSGTTPSCTVEMSEAKKVTALFQGGSGPVPSGGSAALRRIGPAVVKKTATGYAVTLRFRTGERGRARMRALLVGRVETALAFTAAAGAATVGPFPVAKPGFYEFELRLGSATIRWTACLGRCGEHASRSPFTLTRGLPTAIDADALWSLTLHFRSSQAASGVVRIYRSKRLVRTVRFPIRAGVVDSGALLLSPGTYRVALTATDSVGRIRTLTWYALLP